MGDQRTQRAKRPENLAQRVVQPTRSGQHLRPRIDGFGLYESSSTSTARTIRATLRLLSDAHVAGILWAHKQCHNALSLDLRVNHFAIFKNHGRDAGTSLRHRRRRCVKGYGR